MIRKLNVLDDLDCWIQVRKTMEYKLNQFIKDSNNTIEEINKIKRMREAIETINQTIEEI